MNTHPPPAWQLFLPTDTTLALKQLLERVIIDRQIGTIYPTQSDMLRALDVCLPDSVKVVILGQDPYHGPNQAHGLAFSVPSDVPIPPSLKNIYKEIASDIGSITPQSGNLERWAAQGVLLLNTSLSVAAGAASSHASWGWQEITDAIISTLSKEKEHIVFLLWGTHAMNKRSRIDSNKHLILTATHPSPLSAYRGFFGCKHFSQANTYLKLHNRTPIAW